MLDQIIRFFRFGRQDGEFELLETERGIPEFWGDAREEAPLPEQEDTRKVCKSLAENEERLRISFRADINPDLILRPFTLGGKIPAFLAYLNGMADTDQVSDFILRDGMRPGCLDHARGDLARYTMENVFTMGEAETTEAWADVKQAVMEGRSAVFIETCGQAVLMDTRGFEKRAVGRPGAEQGVLGPATGSLCGKSAHKHHAAAPHSSYGGSCMRNAGRGGRQRNPDRHLVPGGHHEYNAGGRGEAQARTN